MPWSNQAVSLIVIQASAAGFTGFFAYSPVPGLGNLVASITAAAGTDPFGNPYGKGVVVYSAGPRGPSHPAEVGMNANAIGFGSGAASEARNAEIVLGVSSPNAPAEQMNWSFDGPVSTASLASVALQLVSDLANSPGTTTGFQIYTDTAGAGHQIAAWGKAGFGGLICNQITGAQPGTSDTTLAAETWHTLPLNGPGFVAGATLPRYRFEPIGPAGIVRLTGQVKLGAAQAAGAVIATLPAGYQPALQHPFLTVNNLSGAVASVTAALGGSVIVQTNGQVQIIPAGALANVVWLDGITFQLD